MSAVEQAVPATDLLDLAARRVEAATGLAFAGPRRRQFEAGLAAMAEALGLPGAGACASMLLAGPWDDARSALCGRFLTVGETYFFREPRAFALLGDVARMHAAGGARRPLRVWSAGCCTGEEAYSIALALLRHLPPGRIDILATDLNDAFLDVARAGIYRRWSFRRTDPADLAGRVRLLPDGRYAIDAAVRARVRFARLNLADDDWPSAATGTCAQDVIFCRNVLMYFAQAAAVRVVARLRDALVDGGWLVVNASEASLPAFAGFTAEVHDDAIFFRKGVPTAPAAGPAATAADPVPVPVPVPVAPPSARVLAVPQRPRPEDAMTRAHALAQAGRREEALQSVRRAVEAEALSAPLQRDAALFALEHGDPQLARHCVRRLLYLEPDSAIGHYLSALLEDAAGRRPRARSLLRDCRRLAADADLRGAAGHWLERLS